MPGWLRSILVPSDGSAASDAALRVAMRLVAPAGGVIIAHAIDRPAIVAQHAGVSLGGDLGAALAAREADECAIFIRAAEHARAAGIRFESVALAGPAVASIVSLVGTRRVDAIVVAGGYAARIVPKSPVPVFAFHDADAAHGARPFATILVGLDPSPAAQAAARDAIDVAAVDNARVVLADIRSRNATESSGSSALARAAAYALAAGVTVDHLVVRGDSADTLLTAAVAAQADLIVVGTDGGPQRRGGSRRVARAIVRRSRVPVLVTSVPAPTREGVTAAST